MEGNNTGSGGSKNFDVPRDAKTIALILASMGVEEYEPRVVNQLLEFMYRYSSEVFQDALVYSEHAGKPKIDLADVRLAIQSRVNFSFTSPPPREQMLELAQKKNSIPLPIIPPKFGYFLPPDEQCLTAPNYQVTTTTAASTATALADTTGDDTSSIPAPGLATSSSMDISS
eukprot:TRINITY_DN11366_c0_g1_i1.p1 TRINITY_DN11366_c0_g1~~TRINITY_DN11366_c0_g1_i1.p1  ORF type:complete len:172 (+),score=41.79 TRINITY_DN11366_c0_g1_i1:112-627(+)